MTNKEFVLAHLSSLNDEQAYFLGLIIKVLLNEAPNTRDARIAAAVIYKLRGLKVWQIANELHFSDRHIYRMLAEFEQRTRQ